MKRLNRAAPSFCLAGYGAAVVLLLIASGAAIEIWSKIAVALLIGGTIAYWLAAEFTRISEAATRNRAFAYTFCALSVFAVSIVIGAMMAESVTLAHERVGTLCEKREVMALRAFVVLIGPALIGVRFGLKEPEKSPSGKYVKEIRGTKAGEDVEE